MVLLSTILQPFYFSCMKRILLTIIAASCVIASHAGTIIVERISKPSAQVDMATIQTVQFLGKDQTVLFNTMGGGQQAYSGVRSLVFSDFATPVQSVETNTHISVYPNPTADALLIDGAAQGAPMSIYSLNGNLLLTQTANSGTNRIDVTSLPNGLYILRLGNETFKFTKE